MRKSPPRRVAVVHPPSVGWIARCIDGIRRYAAESGGWHLLSSPAAMRGVDGAVGLAGMRGWPGDGIIALLDTAPELRAAESLGLPVVNLGSQLPAHRSVPRVVIDHRRAGWMAADHLLARGLRHLAFFGWKHAWYSHQRWLGFSARAAEAGVRCARLLRDPGTEATKIWMQRIAEPADWLRTLPRPCGVFAIHDFMAQLLLESCTIAGLSVPHDVALIGMDDDATVCAHSSPTLSSIARNSEQVGWEAAALLDRLMRGDAPPAADLVVAPAGVVARQSTDRLYCAEPLVQKTIDLMRLRQDAPLGIAELAAQVGVSRRTLETRFRAARQQSPHELLTTLRVAKAQMQLQQPGTRTIEQVALACGFGSPQAFHAAFRRLTGQTPSEYRKRNSPSR